MPKYDLSSPAAVSAAAELARVYAGQHPGQNSYNAAWLHGYAEALADVSRQLKPELKKTAQKRRKTASHER